MAKSSLPQMWSFPLKLREAIIGILKLHGDMFPSFDAFLKGLNNSFQMSGKIFLRGV
jgi:hypothetical protein